MVFLKAESENWQLEDFQQAEFSCVCEKISSVNKEEVSSWEFCWLKVTPIVCFFNAFFHPWPNQEMHYVTLSRGGSYFFQSLIIRKLFLPIIGLYCVYTINQKTQVMVACRYEISLLMWVVDEVEHLKMNSISVCAHVVLPIFMELIIVTIKLYTMVRSCHFYLRFLCSWLMNTKAKLMLIRYIQFPLFMNHLFNNYMRLMKQKRIGTSLCSRWDWIEQ